MARAGTFEAALLVIIVVLCAVVLVMVMDPSARVSDKTSQSIHMGSPVSKIHMTDDGSLYLFGGVNGNTICAFDGNGNEKWALDVPDKWRVSKSVFATDNGVTYLYLYSFNNTTAAMYDDVAIYEAALENGQLMEGVRSIMAVSDSGRILWRKDMPNDHGPCGGPCIYATCGHVYYYFNDSVVVMDRNGNEQFTLTLLQGPPTVDKHGNIYVVKLLYHPPGGEYGPGGYGNGHVIEAYFPNGTLYWRNDLGQPIYRYIYYKFNYQWADQFNTILVYNDDTLYAWVNDGIVKLSTNGSTIWSKTFPTSNYESLEAMPIDSQGNLYFLFESYPQYIDILTPDGREVLRDITPHNATFRGNTDGIVYFVDYNFNKPIEQVGNQDLMSARITAYDLLGDCFLWNRTIVLDPSELIATGDDVRLFLQHGLALHYPDVDTSDMETIAVGISRQRDQYADEQTIELSPKGIVCNWGIRLAPANDNLYMDYYAYNWQYPIVGNETKYYYANSLYAIADNGTLLWEKPLNSLVTSMAVNNSTLYYSTKNGGFFVENAAKIGGGIALLAIVYLAARFIVIGSVARARSRIEKNENRNSVMKYIADNPGLTARDLARCLGANLGTIRYHLFILELNHKIIQYKGDGKYLRYFTNSRSYSDGQQQAVSLVRREGMGKLLNFLIETPGLTIRELALALGTQESSVGRNLKELLQKGIVTRDMNQDGSPAYYISSQQRDHIAFALGRVRK